MNRIFFPFLSMLLLSGVAGPAHAQNLLGIVGAGGEDALITLGSGGASDSGLVNIGLGGENQILDANVGGTGNIANATVGTGGGSAIKADVGVLNGVGNVGAKVGGSSLLDADVDLLNRTVGVDATIGGGSLANIGISIGGRGTGGNGGNGGTGGNGGNGGGNGGGPIFAASQGGGVPAACAGTSPREVERLIRGTQIGASWQQASNVQIRRVDLCPEMRSWLAAALANSGHGPSLRSAIRGDSLLSASLDRSSYGADRVFAVQQRGNQLTVFVY